jgi:putative transposase
LIEANHNIIFIVFYPDISVSKLVQYIKGKSGRKLLMEFEHLRKKYWGQHLWARGYFAVTVGNVNSDDIQKYIEIQSEQHREDNFKISDIYPFHLKATQENRIEISLKSNKKTKSILT